MSWRNRIDTVLLDVDGTLVDSNYQHALAWYRSFRRIDIIRHVRAKQSGSKVVMMSGSGIHGLEEESLRRGASIFLSGPGAPP